MNPQNQDWQQAQSEALKPFEGQHLWFMKNLLRLMSWGVGFVLGTLWGRLRGEGKRGKQSNERHPIPEPGPAFERFRK